MAKLKYYFMPTRWLAFVRGRILAWALPFHRLEQILYRSRMCRPCLEAGKCTECGCTTPDLFFDPSVYCSGGKWGPMMDKENWEEFKQIYNIDIVVK